MKFKQLKLISKYQNSCKNNFIMLKFLSLILISLLPISAFAIEISSPAFKDGETIPKKYGCKYNGGKDISIPINFSNVPKNAQSIVLIMDDPDAKKVVGKTWVHWILSDIPPDTKYLDEVKYGKLGIGVAGKNSDRSKKYFGPCPPKNEHQYNIKAYSLNTKLEKSLKALTQEKFEKLYENEIISSFMISGKFK